jgi:hypothetical protein
VEPRKEEEEEEEEEEWFQMGITAFLGGSCCLCVRTPPTSDVKLIVSYF